MQTAIGYIRVSDELELVLGHVGSDRQAALLETLK